MCVPTNIVSYSRGALPLILKPILYEARKCAVMQLPHELTTDQLNHRVHFLVYRVLQLAGKPCEARHLAQTPWADSLLTVVLDQVLKSGRRRKIPADLLDPHKPSLHDHVLCVG